MAKKGTKRAHGGKKPRARKQKAVLSITGALWIIWLLQRMGVLTGNFWEQVQRGDVSGAITSLYSAMNANFAGSGLPGTIGSAVGLAIVTGAIRLVAKKGEISLRAPRAISV